MEKNGRTRNGSNADPALFPDDNPVRVGNGRRSRRLFLPKLLDKAANDMRLRGAEYDAAYQIIVRWADMEASGRLARMKETALQGQFIEDVFVKALHYTRFAENLPQWQIEESFRVNGGLADAAIGYFGAEGRDPPRVLIELKGPKVDVDRDRSSGNRTAVQQLWDYLSDVPSCPWGVVCNYVSFRLYHRQKTRHAYELFTLKDLARPEEFRRFYALFERGGLLPVLKGQAARADELLHLSEHRQREVGRELYRDYKQNREALIEHLQAKHGKARDEAIEIAQQLLDRVIFIAFCEDRELLPSNALDRAYRVQPPFGRAKNWQWDNFKQLFRSIDEGNEELGITRYNGGLFREQRSGVDGLNLSSEYVRFLHEIGEYDFRDEVNVDVLGHLFEQSVTDLEALRTGGGAAAGEAKPSGKRKREGIYYTPPHVTRYIVEHTIGTCLNERFAELARKHGIDASAEPSPKKLADWVRYQNARLDAVRGLRVCDPACGSGAFLIAAFEYLEDVYDEIISELALRAGPKNEALHAQVRGWILTENLFGVDLSKEAVEITQLALWIRTAERGKTLADLSQNIQCGNSIVDDAKVDPRALDWRARFAGVFKEGGFDCVIGNPPYVKLQTFRRSEPKIAEYLVKRYRSASTGNFDMYLPFIERGVELLRPGGRMGFIAPNLWLFNEYGEGLRGLVAEGRTLERFVDFKSYQVFEDATTYTALQFFRAARQPAIEVADASSGNLSALSPYRVSYKGLGGSAWSLVGERTQRILDKMRSISVPLEEATSQIFQGLITSADAVYHLIKQGPGRYYSESLKRDVEIEDEIMKPLVSGEDAVRFATPMTEKRLLFPYRVTGTECRLLNEREISGFRRAWKYLQANEKALRSRESAKFDDDQWWRFGRHQNIDKQELPKIGVPQTVNRLQAFLDEGGELYFNNVRVNGILARADKRFSLPFLLALLNSRALDYHFRQIAKPKDREYFEANKQFIAPLPIPNTKDQKPLAKLAEKLCGLHRKKLETQRAVHRRFVTDLPATELLATSPLPPSLPGKLKEFDELPVGAMLEAAEEFAGRRLKPTEKAEWDAYVTKATTKIGGLKREIADAEGDLNERVDALYGLSAEDVKVIAGERPG